MRDLDLLKRSGSLWFLLLLLLAPAAHGQSLTSGWLGGVVSDAEGAPLSGARVLLQDPLTGVARTVTTERDGLFAFSLLAPGDYEVAVEQLGYRPVRVRAIPVRAGQRLRVPVQLALAPPPVERVDTVHYEAGSLVARRPGIGRSIDAAEFERVPHAGRELVEVARLSSLSSSELALQGLPSSLGGIAADGMLLGPVQPFGALGGVSRGAAHPLSAYEYVELVNAGVDVEWTGAAGGFLHGHSRRGTRDFLTRAFGSFGRGSGEPGLNSAQGGFLLSGPIVRDTASFVVGVEAWRAESAPILGEGSAEALSAAATSTYGATLPADELSRAGAASAVSLFGRLDWQFGATSVLSVRASAAARPDSELGAPVPPLAGARGTYQGQDVSAGLLFASQPIANLAQEARLGVERSGRSFASDDPFTGLATTRLGGMDGAFGPLRGLPTEMDHTALRASETVYYTRGAHTLKGGIAATLASYEQSYDDVRGAEFLFAGLEGFQAGQGYFTLSQGTGTRASFAIPQVAAYVQDSWTPTGGLDVLLGLRYEQEKLPSEDITLNERWLELTGLPNVAVEPTWSRLSPRFGFSWDIQEQHRWLLHGTAGVFSGTVAPNLVAELLAESGGTRVRRLLGTFGSWPDSPDAVALQEGDATLTLLARDFRSPRTMRATGGISRLLGESTVLHLFGTYRDTDYLPRRVDLNRIPAATGRDVNGRPLFGELVRLGGLLVPAPGTSRRFGEFDQVWAVNLDGYSEYRAVTVELERRPGRGLGLFGSYTFSQTRDNWMGAGYGVELAEAQLDPFAGGEMGDWNEGISDLDVPHRAVAGAELELPGGFALTALYRFRSGLPFTPGFGEGIDANGDGSFLNDPAFVAEGIPGLEDALSRWSCLQDARGAFVERNSCRTDAVHSVDVRLRADLLRLGGSTASLVVDGLNLLDSQAAYPDRALLRLDPAREVTMAGDRVSVPWTVNPNFGNPLAPVGTGRTLRLGFWLNY